MTPYTSGRWLVRPGEEDAFVAAWTAFTEWSVAHAPGARSFVLIRHAGEPRRFVSFGGWENDPAVAAWRGHPEFGQRLGECRALCEEFEASDYVLAARVPQGGE
jgi:heme-degrading monooxygenase HmoA